MVDNKIKLSKAFIEKVLGLTKKIPKGRVITYLEIAKKLGNRGWTR